MGANDKYEAPVRLHDLQQDSTWKRFVTGHDFSRAEQNRLNERALAPVNCLDRNTPLHRCFARKNSTETPFYRIAL